MLQQNTQANNNQHCAANDFYSTPKNFAESTAKIEADKRKRKRDWADNRNRQDNWCLKECKAETNHQRVYAGSYC